MLKNYFVILMLMFAISACEPKYQASDMCSMGDSPVATINCPLVGDSYDPITDWLDEGKLDYKESFMGYWMVGLNAKHMPGNWERGGKYIGLSPTWHPDKGFTTKEDQCKASSGCIREITISLNQGKGLENQYDHKLASVTNIKSDLSGECGTNWEPMRATQRFPQRSYKDRGNYRYNCIFELNNRKKQYDITFYRRSLERQNSNNLYN